MDLETFDTPGEKPGSDLGGTGDSTIASARQLSNAKEEEMQSEADGESEELADERRFLLALL